MKDRICEFECNIDDMTAEEIAFAAERLMEEGAKDVTLASVQMKKGRPLLMLRNVVQDKFGVPVIFAVEYFREDQFHFRITRSRG